MEELNSGPPKTNPSSGREEDLNSGPLDYKSSTLALGHARLRKGGGSRKGGPERDPKGGQDGGLEGVPEGGPEVVKKGSSRGSMFCTDPTSSFKFGGKGQTNVFYSRVMRASGCYYCKFPRNHRRPEAYQSFQEKAVSLCFS